MRVLFFAAKYLPSVGGIERYTSALARKLLEKGHSVAVATSCLQRDDARYVQDADGSEIYRIPAVWLMAQRFPLPIPGREMRELRRRMAEGQFDFVIIQARFYPAHMWAAYLCRRYRLPAIVVEHGSDYLLRGGLLGALGKAYEQLAARYIYKKCPDFYGVSEACCKWLSRFGIRAKGCLYNAVDPAELSETAACGRAALAARVSFEGKRTVAYAGRFVPEKGVLELAEAFGRVHAAQADTQLVMAGDGPCYRQMHKKNLPGVILTGALPYDQTLALIQRSEIFCLPSRYPEGLPTSVLEAAALKTAIVVGDAGGSAELVVDEAHGILLKTADASEIAAALNGVLAAPERAAQCAENAYQRLLGRFTWEQVVDELLRIYARMHAAS